MFHLYEREEDLLVETVLYLCWNRRGSSYIQANMVKLHRVQYMNEYYYTCIPGLFI